MGQGPGGATHVARRFGSVAILSKVFGFSSELLCEQCMQRQSPRRPLVLLAAARRAAARFVQFRFQWRKLMVLIAQVHGRPCHGPRPGALGLGGCSRKRIQGSSIDRQCCFPLDIEHGCCILMLGQVI